MSHVVTECQVKAGVIAGRKALDDYSSFQSHMVPDDVLEAFVYRVALAVVNAGNGSDEK